MTKDSGSGVVNVVGNKSCSASWECVQLSITWHSRSDRCPGRALKPVIGSRWQTRFTYCIPAHQLNLHGDSYEVWSQRRCREGGVKQRAEGLTWPNMKCEHLTSGCSQLHQKQGPCPCPPAQWVEMRLVYLPYDRHRRKQKLRVLSGNLKNTLSGSCNWIGATQSLFCPRFQTPNIMT